MAAASAWETVATEPAAVSIPTSQNRCLELVAPAILVLKNRCPLTRKPSNPGTRIHRLAKPFVVAEAKSVHQRRPYNFSAFRPDRSKKASHSVKRRPLDQTPSVRRY